MPRCRHPSNRRHPPRNGALAPVARPCPATVPAPDADPSAPVLLHTARSPHHEIHVYQSGTTRYLTFEASETAAAQSIIDSTEPHSLVEGYRHGLVASVALHPRPSRVLCLGVGAGLVPLAVRRVFPDAVVDAVDLDTEVIRVARDWFGFSADDGLRLHVADARDFLRRAGVEGRRWDVILQDVFDRQYIPAHLMTVEYFRELSHVLERDGVFAINTFAQGHFHERELATYAEVFTDGFEISTDGPNRVIVAWPQPMPDEARLHVRLEDHAGELRRAGVCAAAMARRMRPLARRLAEPHPFTDDCLHAELASLRALALDQAQAAAEEAPPARDVPRGPLRGQLRILPPAPTTLIST